MYSIDFFFIYDIYQELAGPRQLPQESVSTPFTFQAPPRRSSAGAVPAIFIMVDIHLHFEDISVYMS